MCSYQWHHDPVLVNPWIVVKTTDINLLYAICFILSYYERDEHLLLQVILFFSSVADSKKRTLFVKNIGFDVKEDDIKAHFPLAQKVFVPHKMDGKLKGWVFDTYTHLSYDTFKL